MEMTEKEFDLVGHSLGINIYHARHSDNPKDKYLPEEFYRNYFCTSQNTTDYAILAGLKERGIADRWEKFNNIYFSVTEKGIQAFRMQFSDQITSKYIPPPAKKLKSRLTYLNFLDRDCGLTFAESLGIVLPKREYDKNGLIRFVSEKYTNVKGEFKKTVKEAKHSYKNRLREYKLSVLTPVI